MYSRPLAFFRHFDSRCACVPYRRNLAHGGRCGIHSIGVNLLHNVSSARKVSGQCRSSCSSDTADGIADSLNCSGSGNAYGYNSLENCDNSLGSTGHRVAVVSGCNHLIAKVIQRRQQSFHYLIAEALSRAL